MRVAITGGLGFIGSHLAERFADRGDEVLVIDDRRGSVVETLWPKVKHYSWMPVQEWCQDDHFETDFDLFVHCAAPVGPGLVSSMGGRIAWQIIDATTAVADYCAPRGIPLLNISSSEVYGVPDGSGDAIPEPYTEQWPIGHDGRFSPRSEYGLAKATAENALACTVDLLHGSIRPFNTVGPRQAASKGFVLPTFIEQAKANKPLTVYEPTAVRSLTSVHDLVDFIVEHWWTVAVSGRPWNVASMENEIEMADLAQLVINTHIAATGSDGKWIETDPTERWGDHYRFFGYKNGTKLPDSTKAMSLGWKPTRFLVDIVSEAYAA